MIWKWSSRRIKRNCIVVECNAFYAMFDDCWRGTRKENIAGYNCSYVKVDTPRSFDEILYVLMNGTGVGFSVEIEHVNHLPTIAEEFHPTDTTIVVADSKLGWAKAFKELLSLLWSGQIPKWDLSKVRAAGNL